MSYVSYRHTDMSESHNTQLFTRQLKQLGVPIAEIRILRPFSLSDFLCIMFYLIRNIEDVGKYHLNDRVCTVGRNIRDNDSTFFRFFNVNHVVACRQNADIFQCGKSFHFLFQDTDFIGQDYFCTLATFNYFAFLRVFVDMTLA